jgi:hypothetical protein
MLPVLDMMSFFFRIYTKVKAIVLPTSAFTCVLILEKKLVISNTDLFSFVSIVMYLIYNPYVHHYT